MGLSTGLILLSLASLCISEEACSFNNQDIASCSSLPKIRSFNHTVSEISLRGLEPFSKLGKAIISFSSSQISSLLSEAESLKRSPTTSSKKALKMLDSTKGVVAGLVIGIVLAVFVPIIGVIFCCCRLCDNCGGKRYQDRKAARRHACCFVQGALLLIFAGLYLAGGCLVIGTAGIIHDGAVDVQKVPGQSIDFIRMYCMDLKQQIDVFYNNIIFLTGGTLDLHTIFIVMGSEQTVIRGKVTDIFQKFDNVLSGLLLVRSRLQNTSDAVSSVILMKDSVSAMVDQLLSDIKQLNSACPTCTQINTDKLATLMEAFNVPDIFELLRRTDGVLKNINLTESKDNSLDTMVRLFAEKRSLLTDINDEFNRTVYRNTFLGDVLKEIDKIQSNVEGIGSDRAFQDTASLNTNYVTVVVSIIGALVVFLALLFLLGLFFGCCGYNKKVAPPERTCVSSCGGQFIMSGVGLTLIFYFILMMIAVVIFAISALGNGACTLLSNSALTKRLFNLFVDQNTAQAATEIYQGENNDVTFYRLLKSLSIIDADPLFNSLKSINSSSFDINMNTTFSEIDFDTSVANSSVKNLQNILDNQFENITKISNISYDVNLTQLKTELSTAKQNAGNNTLRVEKIDLLIQNVSKLEEQLNIAGFYLNAAKRLSIPLKNDTLYSKDSLVDAINYSSNTIHDLVDNETKIFNKLKTGVLNTFDKRKDSMIAYVNNTLFYNVASTRSIGSFLKYIISGVICKRIILTLNGFWLGLGSAMVFAVFSIIFGVRLAKFLRRMETDTMKAHFDMKNF